MNWRKALKNASAVNLKKNHEVLVPDKLGRAANLQAHTTVG